MHTLGALPAEVSPDSILEALLEIRYETQVLPEIVYGRIVDNSNWEGFAQSTLPAYAFPAELRQIDPDLRYAPVLQLVSSIRSLRLVEGDLPEETSAFIDVDVYTGEDYASSDIQAVKAWIDLAHDHEKAQFFRVFSPEMIATWSTKP